MAKARPRPRKPQPAAKRSGTLRPGLRAALLLLLLVLLCFTAWGVVRIVFLGPVMRPHPAAGPERAIPEARRGGGETEPSGTTVSHRRPGLRPHLPRTPVIAARPSKRPAGRRQTLPAAGPSRHGGAPHRARMGIVIDDMGYHRLIGTRLIDLDLDLSFAFLPQTPFAGELCHRAAARGRDILLHLPMQPEDPGRDPGPGALLVHMTAAQIQQVLDQDLAGLTGVVGVNNHMGSRFSRDSAAMATLLAMLKERHLFFLDSLTTPASVGAREAERLGLPALQRDVFLDNEPDERAIGRQLALLAERARQHGMAVGIAHPRPATLAALASFQPPPGVELVPVHQLLTDGDRR